jgi:hypothetical protein
VDDTVTVTSALGPQARVVTQPAPGRVGALMRGARRYGNRRPGFLVNHMFKTQFTDLSYGYSAFWARHLDGLQLIVRERFAESASRPTEVESAIPLSSAVPIAPHGANTPAKAIAKGA